MEGNRNAPRRFSDEQAMDILDRYAQGGVTQRELAVEFDCPIPTINAILTRRSYIHVGTDLPQAPPDPNPWPTAPFGYDDTDNPWADRANCIGVDPDLFFPERGDSTKEAKAICHGCEVRIQCLEAALIRGEKHGIWGGLSERQRRGMRKLRRIAKA